MRIIIYGAGAIGGAVGGHLARTGENVVLIGRPYQVKAITEGGLKLITPTETHLLQIPAVTGPDQIRFTPEDVVFLCMKGQQTEGALRDLIAVTSDVPIFCLQNGIQNEEVASRYFPRIYGVTVRVGAVYLKDGEVTVRRDPPGWFVMSCYPRGTDELVENAAKRLRRAGFVVMVVPDVMPYKWGKLVVNLANVVGAITSAKREEVAPITQAARKEAAEILGQAGQHWVSAEQMEEQWPEIKVLTKATLQTEAQSSTWQSLARQLGNVETDLIQGEIVRLARKIGREAPINEKLLNICKEMAAQREVPGKYTPARLSELLGLS